MNLVHIIGYLGRDPEESCTPNGRKLWTLTVATRVRGRTKGEEETIWWRLTIWGDEYDRMLQHLAKGRPVYAVAEMTRKFGTYTDKNGQTQVSYEATVRSLHFVPVGGDRQQGGEGAQQGGQTAGGYSKQPTPQAAAVPQQEPAASNSFADEATAPAGAQQPQAAAAPHHDDEPMPF